MSLVCLFEGAGMEQTLVLGDLDEGSAMLIFHLSEEQLIPPVAKEGF